MADDGSFPAFVAARWPAMVRYAYLLTGDVDAAQDAVQTALEKCWGRWSSIAADRPEAYVRAAVTNAVISRHRWRVRRVREVALDDALDPFAAGYGSAAGAVGDGAEGRAVHAVLWREVQALPPRMRAVVVLRLWEDLPEAEVAVLLRCSVGSVKSQLSRALARLRDRAELRELVGLGSGAEEER